VSDIYDGKSFRIYTDTQWRFERFFTFCRAYANVLLPFAQAALIFIKRRYTYSKILVVPKPALYQNSSRIPQGKSTSGKRGGVLRFGLLEAL
jgi:hypothetical protein